MGGDCGCGVGVYSGSPDSGYSFSEGGGVYDGGEGTALLPA